MGCGYAEPEQAEARWEGSDWHGTIPAAAKPMGPKQPGHPPPAAAMPMQPSRAVGTPAEARFAAAESKGQPYCPVYKSSAKQAQPAAAPAKPSQPNFPPPAKAYGYMDEESKIWVNRRQSPACMEPESSLHGVAPKTPEFMKEEPKTPEGEKSDDEVDALEAAVREQARVRLKTS